MDSRHSGLETGVRPRTTDHGHPHPALGGLGRPSLFWDVRLETVDPVRNRDWIISRVLAYGLWEEVRLLFRLYAADVIRQSVSASRTLDAHVRDFWLEFGPSEEMLSVFHAEVLDPATGSLLEGHGSTLAQPGFCLCGGTALALRLGHRVSQDLDLLTTRDFDSMALWNLLQDSISDAMLVERTTNTLHTTLAGVEVSFLKQSGIQIEARGDFAGVPVATLDTLAALKLNAVVGRGTRKDFVDLYTMCQNGWTIDSLLAAAKTRAPKLNPTLILRSLTHFEDAERDPLPRMLAPYEWAAASKYFRQHVRAYMARELSQDR
jgi:hypothetical protein